MKVGRHHVGIPQQVCAGPLLSLLLWVGPRVSKPRLTRMEASGSRRELLITEEREGKQSAKSPLPGRQVFEEVHERQLTG